jgi:epoxyqueuosine reductase
MGLTEQIKQKAINLGFDLVGITDAAPLPVDCLNRLLAWLDAGHAASMDWMQNNLDKRTNPAALLPGAKSVIVVGLNYKPPPLLRRSHLGEAGGRVASFAQYEDYHPFIKKQLRKLAEFIIERTGHAFKFQICVDSTPLFERALAVKAGLGFIGKNRMLVNPRLGPQILLGEIITNLDLKSEIDARHQKKRAETESRIMFIKSAKRDSKSEIPSPCQSCSKCISACPTGALQSDGSFDASKCISFLTIESDAVIPADLAPKIGNHLFGCSECVLACPYHKNAPPSTNKQFTHYPDRAELNLNEILTLTEPQFQLKFASSPILRTGLDRLKRNAVVCLKNLSL